MSDEFIPLRIDRTVKDLRTLTRMERAAYFELLLSMWLGGGKLPGKDDKLARSAGCSAKEWASVKGPVLDLFERQGGSLFHTQLTPDYTRFLTAKKGFSRGGKMTASRKANKNSGDFAENDETAKEKNTQNPVDNGADSEKPNKINENRPSLATAKRQLSRHRLKTIEEEERERGKSISEDARARGFENLRQLNGEAVDFVAGQFAALYPDGYGAEGCGEDMRALLAEGIDPVAILDGLRRAVDDWTAAKQIGTRWIPEARNWLAHRKWLLGGGRSKKPAYPTWQGPAEIRAAVVDARGEAFAVRWLDPCEWSNGALVARSGMAADELEALACLDGYSVLRRAA